MPDASSVTVVPVLFVSEPIVLPTMVVPIELDDAARTAVDAAQASESGKLLIAPRLDDRYPTYGVLASIVQHRDKATFRNRATRLRHEPLVIREIVHRHEHRSQHFPCLEQMTQVTAAVPACYAGTCGIERSALACSDSLARQRLYSPLFG